MENYYLFFGSLFVMGYILIATEHKNHLNKSGVAVVLGSVLWLLVALLSKDKNAVSVALMENGSEIFSIIIFLMSAMTIVEILVHYQFFNWIREKLVRKKLSQSKLFWLLGFITFVMSACLDNLTTTLIMLQIGRKIYKDKNNFLIYAANTVIAANAGGAASPIGDVTTIMLWLAGKYTAVEIMTMGTLPAFVTWLIPQFLIGRKIINEVHLENKEESTKEEKVNPSWGIITIGLCSFVLPVIFNIILLPPFLGLLLGLGILWVFIDIKAYSGDENHSVGKIVNMIQRIDLSTLKFFIGILLSVGALAHIGLLKELNNLIFGAEINELRLVLGNTILGLSSAIIDNVPLVAAAIKMFPATVEHSIWVLLALTAGTGGSILVIGSAAGVAAMGQAKGLTFVYYMRVAAIPALLGFLGGIGVWALISYH